MAERKFCTVRFNLEKPEHQKAWERLQNMDRTRHKSYSAVIIAALNEYLGTDLADTIVKKLLNHLKSEDIGHIPELTQENSENKENIAWDYLGGKIDDIEIN
ncbi:MAG: hypothetical protein ACI4RF_05180 [Eubacterium sp.]